MKYLQWNLKSNLKCIFYYWVHFCYYLKAAIRYKKSVKITDKEEYIINHFRSIFYLHLVNFISQFWERCRAERLTFQNFYLPKCMSSNRYLWQYTWCLEFYHANLKSRLHKTKTYIHTAWTCVFLSGSLPCFSNGFHQKYLGK